MTNTNSPDLDEYYKQKAIAFGINMVVEDASVARENLRITTEIENLEAALSGITEAYVRIHPSSNGKSELGYVHFPLTSHNAMPQLYERINNKLNELRQQVSLR